MTPSELLTTLVVERRMLEVAATGARARDGWRRLRFVVDQARAWSEVEHGGLRAYLAWADRQGEETSRVSEAVLPERDLEAVRVMTVHAAKGLQFPIVVLSGMTSQPHRPGGVQVLWPSGGYAVRLTKSAKTVTFEAQKPVDEQMDEYERLRLLYVATTRAQDHLVVSLHRCADSTTQSSAKILADAGAATAPGAVAFFGDPPVAEAASSASVAPPPDYAAWLAELEAVREASRRASAISASGLEGTEPAVELNPQVVEIAGRAKGKRNLEEPPWAKGRYGTAVGRAVHAVLQVVDLTTGEGLDDAVAAQCVAEGVVEHTEVVRAMARAALDSEVVQRAAAREHWRESYVGTVQGDGIVHEGFADLIYREDDGSLVVVDYKTDAVPEAAVPVRSAIYQPQMDAYVEMLGAATGVDAHSTLLFTGTHVG
jgi:ATP-dependent exoDNAse (exonuclease V) beta subunit